MPRVTGRVAASFTDVDGVTRLGDRYHSYPLKIAKAFSFDEGQLGIYMMDASPGIMSGDAYELEWRFGENTKAFITNQSYTKVHPMLCDAEGVILTGLASRFRDFTFHEAAMSSICRSR